MKKVILGLMLAIGMTAVMSCNKEKFEPVIVTPQGQESTDGEIDSQTKAATWAAVSAKILIGDNDEVSYFTTISTTGDMSQATNDFIGDSLGGFCMTCFEPWAWGERPADNTDKERPTPVSGTTIITVILTDGVGKKHTTYFQENITDASMSEELEHFLIYYIGVPIAAQ